MLLVEEAEATMMLAVLEGVEVAELVTESQQCQEAAEVAVAVQP